jgi:hypothetical protein
MQREWVWIQLTSNGHATLSMALQVPEQSMPAPILPKAMQFEKQLLRRGEQFVP